MVKSVDLCSVKMANWWRHSACVLREGELLLLCRVSFLYHLRGYHMLPSLAPRFTRGREACFFIASVHWLSRRMSRGEVFWRSCCIASWTVWGLLTFSSTNSKHLYMVSTSPRDLYTGLELCLSTTVTKPSTNCTKPFCEGRAFSFSVFFWSHQLLQIKSNYRVLLPTVVVPFTKSHLLATSGHMLLLIN